MENRIKQLRREKNLTSDPDGYTGNNWSHHGNTSPYTGKRGYNNN